MNGFPSQAKENHLKILHLRSRSVKSWFICEITQLHIQNDHFSICAHRLIWLRCSQISVFDCLDAKHWDPSVWTFARRIAYMCAKLLPIFIRGTFIPKILMHISLLIEWDIPSLPKHPPPDLCRRRCHLWSKIGHPQVNMVVNLQQ